MSHGECHLMVDIETLSTRTDAHVISMAMASFDPYGDRIEKVELIVPGYETCPDLVGHIDLGTIGWHMERMHKIPKPTIDALQCVRALNHALTWTRPPTHIWAKAPSFDLRILENLFLRAGVPWKLSYQTYRDVRTLCETLGLNVSTSNNHSHNPVEDVEVQCRAVQDAYRILGLDHSGPAAPVGSAFREEKGPLPLFQKEEPDWAKKPFAMGWIFVKDEAGPELITIENHDVYMYNRDGDGQELDRKTIAWWSKRPMISPCLKGL